MYNSSLIKIGLYCIDSFVTFAHETYVMHFFLYHKIVLCDKGGCAGILYSFERMHNNLFNQFFLVRHLGGCFCSGFWHFTLVNNSVINICVVEAFQLGSSQSPPNPLWHCSWRAHGLGT